MSKPRFTFCIPNLNKIEYLPACIDSMLAQDCQNWRCVFVDGYSTDGSWEYMEQFASDSRFLLLRGRRQGMYEDWNECLKHVETEYFYFLTSDDTCLPKLVSETTAALDSHPDVDVCHFQFSLINHLGEPFYSYDEFIHQELDLYTEVYQYSHLRSGLCEFINHFIYRTLYRTITSLVFRKRLIAKMDRFSSRYGSLGDYDWTMKLGLFTDILYIPELLATWRIYEGQATHDLGSVLNTERRLEIARANLTLFSELNHSNHLRNPINRQEILSDFYDEYASSLLKSAYSNQSLDKSLNYLYKLLTDCPLYPIRKAINRISRGNFFQYHSDRKQFAQTLIDYYGLQWLPANSI